ncbi:MAG: LysR family transcriptional regulator [Verrucomicrobia bacterium]|nr:LysR family transcriptional regulator [Verrucomicrobiota bacterium]
MPYGIQQPAISGQLSQLEKALGVRLFERRPFGLNPAGAKLFKEIEPFFAGLRDLPAHVRGLAQQHLRLAAPGRILRDYLPDVIARYKRRHPHLELTLYDANQARAEELLRRREVDMAITEIEGPMAGSFLACELVQLPLVIVVPRRSKRRAITDLFSDGRPIEKLISLRPSEVLSKNFRAGLNKLDRHWPIASEVISLELIDIYTSLGFGVGSSVFIPGRKVPRGSAADFVAQVPAIDDRCILARWAVAYR